MLLDCLDKNTAHKLYWDDELSIEAIADIYGVGSTTVRRRLDALGISRRQLNPNMYKDWEGAPHRNRELLRRLYWDEELSAIQIADQLAVSDSVIGLWMDKLGIPKRAQAIATHLAIGNSVDLSNEAMSFLAGELLGDGSLVENKSISAAYFHGSKHKAYLEWLRDTLLGFGIEPVGIIREYHHFYEPTGRHYMSYNLTTKSYPELMGLRRKWYPQGKKHPPRDLILDGLSLREWFIGDGNYRERYRHNRLDREVRIAEFEFTDSDRLFLQGLLANLKIETTITKDGFRVRNKCIDRFFEVIGQCPVPHIYGYKWPSSIIPYWQPLLL